MTVLVTAFVVPSGSIASDAVAARAECFCGSGLLERNVNTPKVLYIMPRPCRQVVSARADLLGTDESVQARIADSLQCSSRGGKMLES